MIVRWAVLVVESIISQLDLPAQWVEYAGRMAYHLAGSDGGLSLSLS